MSNVSKGTIGLGLFFSMGLVAIDAAGYLPDELQGMGICSGLVLAFTIILTTCIAPWVYRESQSKALDISIFPDVLVINGQRFPGKFSTQHALIASPASFAHLAEEATLQTYHYRIRPSARVVVHPMSGSPLTEAESDALERVLRSIFLSHNVAHSDESAVLAPDSDQGGSPCSA